MNLLTPSDFNSPLTITELTSPNKKVLVIEDKQLLLNRQNINMKFNYYLIFEFDTKKFYFCDKENESVYIELNNKILKFLCKEFHIEYSKTNSEYSKSAIIKQLFSMNLIFRI